VDRLAGLLPDRALAGLEGARASLRRRLDERGEASRDIDGFAVMAVPCWTGALKAGSASGVAVFRGDVQGGRLRGVNLVLGAVLGGDLAGINVIRGEVRGGRVRGVNLVLGDVRGGDVAGANVVAGDVYGGRVRALVLIGDVHGGDVAVARHFGRRIEADTAPGKG
jgi:hypothetical protein